MERRYMLGLLCVLVCLFWDLPTTSGFLNAANFGPRRCNDKGTWGTGAVCMNKTCYECRCRLPEQCFLNTTTNEVGCDCSDDTDFTGDYCKASAATPERSSIKTFWIGLLYHVQTEKFVWRDYTENTVDFWGPGMPLTGRFKRCAAYLYEPYNNFYWEWYASGDCVGNRRPFICERAEPPPPAK